MCKIIFLDIDGVLNHNPWQDKCADEITEDELIISEKVEVLGQIVEKTNAQIVLHSGWRFWFNQNLQPTCSAAKVLVKKLANEGLMITDVTPDYSTEEIRKAKRYSLVKAKEILAWISEHREVDSWIVLDDLDLHNEIVMAHQIQIDASQGLCLENVQEAEKLLR